jgi:hypothetical protein
MLNSHTNKQFTGTESSHQHNIRTSKISQIWRRSFTRSWQLVLGKQFESINEVSQSIGHLNLVVSTSKITILRIRLLKHLKIDSRSVNPLISAIIRFGILQYVQFILHFWTAWLRLWKACCTELTNESAAIFSSKTKLLKQYFSI